MRPRVLRTAALVCGLFGCLVPTTPQFADEISTATANDSSAEMESGEEAEFRVRGYGLLGNRTLSRIVQILRIGEEPENYYSPGFLENVLMLLHSQVERDGYFRPNYQLKFTSIQGEMIEMSWDGHAWLDLPPALQTRSALVQIERGPRFFYEEISFNGLEAFSHEEAGRFFVSDAYLFNFKRYRVYSPSARRNGKSNLLEELRSRGFRDARVFLEEEVLDEETGAVSLAIGVDEGPRYAVIAWDEEWDDPATPTDVVPLRSRVLENEPWYQSWQRNQVREVLNRFFRAGFPDASARVVPEYTADGHADEIAVRLRVLIQPGPRVRVGEIEFSGEGKTRESVLLRRLPFASGDWLDILSVEDARFRLGRLRIFRRIEVGTEVSREAAVPPQEEAPGSPEVTGEAREVESGEPPRRDVHFRFEEDRRMNASLLLGYGTYEKLRGGVEVERRNLWGRAHRDRLRLIQSFKSSLGAYRYAMPEVFAEDIDLQAETSWMRRQELSFDRVEVGAEVRLFKEFSPRSRMMVGYRLERLRAVGLEEADDFFGARSTRVGALQIGINRDTRDNPLYPTRGIQARAELELGSEFLGADVTYQRLTLFGSIHHPWREGLVLHGRFSHGVATTFGAGVENLPINKRFFPGGPHSIRGFRQGGASPRDSLGQFIGAETFTLLQLEMEQDLGPSLSGVLFTDHLLYGRSVTAYPGETYLLTVGFGVRYRTIIGPLRAELGYNINPRPHDPRYRLQISLGYPF